MVDCPLCYTLFGSGGVDSEAHAFRGCGHVFCRGCIAQLTRIGCPVCRWKPPSAHASNLSSEVVLRLFIDFSEANTFQTKFEDTKKKLAAAQREMDRFKEEVRRDAEKKLEQSKEEARRETNRLQRKWKDEADSLKVELEKANRKVEYLTRRVEDEKLRSTKDIAALVSAPRQHSILKGDKARSRLIGESLPQVVTKSEKQASRSGSTVPKAIWK